MWHAETIGTKNLVYTLEWWHGLALVLVERLINHTTVLDVDLGARGIVLPGEGVLHPVFVITLYQQFSSQSSGESGTLVGKRTSG